MKFMLIMVLSLLLQSLHAQVADSNFVVVDSASTGAINKNLCLLTGINYSNHVFADIGISMNFSPSGGIHPTSSSYYFANEVHFVNRPFIGPKLGASLSILITTIGVNIIYYTDFKKQNAFALRPEVGIGADRFRIMYGYNKILNKSVDRLSRNNLGMVYCFKLKK